jgi:RimJ/RimL family protein N-acetyltransferase
MEGHWCRLEPLVPASHGDELHAALADDREGAIWTYLPYGPFPDRAAFEAWLVEMSRAADPLAFAIRERRTGRTVGLCAYLRIEPAAGSIEVGHLVFSPRLQRTPVATDAMYCMMRQAFGLGYRRYEWKCDSLNAASRAAAVRLGFRYEGLFRQARVTKGRNRDTAWFSVIDSEWPALRGAFERWLAPGNFDAAGRQQSRLSDLTSALKPAEG